MSIIPEIIRQIDNNAKLTAAFQTLTEEAFDEQGLADMIQNWFENKYEDITVEGIWGCNNQYERELATLYESVLQQAIASITKDQWLTIAQHLWRRYWTQRTADQIGCPH
jgi:tRNA splicing ligase